MVAGFIRPMKPQPVLGAGPKPANSFEMNTTVGGGTPSLGPVAMDPRGLVPVNRAQPRATRPQHLMENRLGTQPISSFSGSGAAFVPADRPTAPHFTTPAIKSDFANAELMNGVSTAPTPPLSAQAVQQVTEQQALYGGQPNATADSPVRATSNQMDVLDRLMERFGDNPTVLAQIEAMRDRKEAMRDRKIAARARPRGRPEMPGMATPADRIRELLRGRVGRAGGVGLLGVGG